MATATLPATTHAAPPATIPGPGRMQLGGAAAMQQTIEDINLVREFVAHEMKGDLDFGVIPGTTKPTLYQPGAQKVLMFFNAYPDYEIQTENFDRGHVEHIVKAVLRSRATQGIIGTGVGSASSLESKYRWRQAERTCPKCGKASIIKGRDEFGGGWVCFAKKGGCGAKFADGDQVIEGQTVGRIENPDIYDVRNTVLKIAKKRSMVDAALGLSCLSEYFTQDLDEYPPAEESPRSESRPAKQTTSQPSRDRQTTKPESAKKAAAPKAAEAPKADTWAGWIVRELQARNDEFANEQAMTPVPKDQRVKEVMNQFEAANLVASACIYQGIIKQDRIAQRDNPDKRDRTKVLEFVTTYFRQYPDWVKETVIERYQEKQDELARKLGVYNPDADPVDEDEEALVDAPF